MGKEERSNEVIYIILNGLDNEIRIKERSRLAQRISCSWMYSMSALFRQSVLNVGFIYYVMTVLVLNVRVPLRYTLKVACTIDCLLNVEELAEGVPRDLRCFWNKQGCRRGRQ
jgi:hypothetical protein